MARQKDQKLPIIILFKKTIKGKYFIIQFNDILIDDIIGGHKRVPLLNDKYIIEEIGLGTRFIEKYQKSHNARFC
jgi:hypothetical protein